MNDVCMCDVDLWVSKVKILDFLGQSGQLDLKFQKLWEYWYYFNIWHNDTIDNGTIWYYCNNISVQYNILLIIILSTSIVSK